MTWAGVLADFAARKNEIQMFSIARYVLRYLSTMRSLTITIICFFVLRGKMICRRNFNVREYATKRVVLSVHDIYSTPFISEPK